MEHRQWNSKNGNNHKIGNKGMSLVEIIIVVAIMAVFAGTMSYSINWASGKAAEECAQKLAYSLQQARTMAMGKNSVTITVKKDDSGNIVTETEIVSNGAASPTKTTSTVGKKTVSVKFYDGTTENELDDNTNKAVFVFDRASGALKTLNGSEANTTSPKFTITKGSTKRTVEIVPITGRISVSK